MRDKAYLAVHVPEFPAQALLRCRPELLRKPVAVLKGVPPLQQVCSINASARRMGVQDGMTRTQLVPFNDLHTLTASSEVEACTQQAIVGALAAFTPSIELQPQAGSSFRIVLDITGTSLLWGEAQVVVRRVAASMRSLRLVARSACSSNVYASLCLASAAKLEPILVSAGREAKALESLPLTVLELTAKQSETFDLWGLRTLGELAALPAQDVVARMGQEGMRLHSMARGTAPHLLVPQETPFLLEELVEFDSPVDDLDSLLFVLGPMLDQLICRAANHAYALASVTTTLRHDGGGEHARTVRPALPTSDRKALLKLLQLDLQAYPPSAGILVVRLNGETGDRSKVQTGLFSPQLPEPMRLDVTLSRIAAIVGQGRVGRARLLDTHDRDRGFVMERFGVEAVAHKSSTHKSPGKSSVPALRRCRPPFELRMAVELSEGKIKPRSFHLHGQLYLVQDAYGPWRQSGDWWSADVWSREEWDIRANTRPGNDTLLAVLRHDLLRKLWTLEALYD